MSFKLFTFTINVLPSNFIDVINPGFFDLKSSDSITLDTSNFASFSPKLYCSINAVYASSNLSRFFNIS